MADERAHDFVIFDVEKIDPDQDSWDVSLGPEPGDPWLTVWRSDIGCEPNIGDIITVQLPRAIAIKNAEKHNK